MIFVRAACIQIGYARAPGGFLMVECIIVGGVLALAILAGLAAYGAKP